MGVQIQSPMMGAHRTHIRRRGHAKSWRNPIVAANTAEVKRFENWESKFGSSSRFLHLRGDFARIDCSKGGEPR